jgi:hypothetical protein
VEICEMKRDEPSPERKRLGARLVYGTRESRALKQDTIFSATSERVPIRGGRFIRRPEAFNRLVDSFWIEG